MKKQITRISLGLVLATGLLFSLNACKKLLSITLDKDYQSVQLLIQAPQSAGNFTISKEIMSDLETLASSYNFDINKIESAKLESLTVDIEDTNPTPYTFDIVDAATATLSADGQSVLEVASDDASQVSPTQMVMDLKGVDIVPYLKSNKFNVNLNLTTNTAITHDVPLKATLKCKFVVKPLG
jgi:hypothetical protein